MGKDVLYTNGIIAVKENSLLKEKLFRMAESSLSDAFKLLVESGFGGAEMSAEDIEAFIEADERETDEFIREYAPSETEKIYLLAPYDFHNAKAIFKAELLNADAAPLLAPEGLYSVALLTEAVKSGEGNVYLELKEAIREAKAKSAELSGAEIGSIFDAALYRLLLKTAAKNSTLKAVLCAKADMTNIMTYLRAKELSAAEKMYVVGGKLSKEMLKGLFSEEEDKAKNSLDRTPYAAFLKTCLEAKSAGQPLKEGERIRDSYEIEYLREKRFELKRSQPFLYYVFRRRAENSDVRILFVGLNAGMKETEIKKRLRSL